MSANAVAREQESFAGELPSKLPKSRLERLWQHDLPITPAFALPDIHQPTIEVQVAVFAPARPLATLEVRRLILD